MGEAIAMLLELMSEVLTGTAELGGTKGYAKEVCASDIFSCGFPARTPSLKEHQSILEPVQWDLDGLWTVGSKKRDPSS
jgi:hypothetical protein